MSAASQITLISITDSYLHLLASLGSIQSVAEMLSRTDVDSSPNSLVQLSRAVFNEVTSALDAAQEMHAMLLAQRQGGLEQFVVEEDQRHVIHLPITLQ